MTLDASVCCDCFERGKLKTPPPFPDRVYVDEDGRLELKESETLAEDYVLHGNWMADEPCEHSHCKVVDHFLGNIARIGALRSIFSKVSPDPAVEFPIISTRIIYNGIHCGDFIEVDRLNDLHLELERTNLLLMSCDLTEPEVEMLSYFTGQMRELVAAALSVKKPILF